MRVVTLFFLTTFLLSVSFTSACAQSKKVEKQEPLTFSNSDFEFSLDSNWKRRDNTESFEWEDDLNGQEILISVLTAKEPMNPELRNKTAKELMEIRRKSIDEISEGKATLTAVETTEKDDSTELIVRGVDQTYGMQIYTAVIVHPTRAVTFAYYKYSPLLTDNAFREKSNELRSAIKVH